MGNEGCGYPSVACKKRVTILVEGAEIELFNGEVSVSLPSVSSPLDASKNIHKHSCSRCGNGNVCSHCRQGGRGIAPGFNTFFEKNNTVWITQSHGSLSEDTKHDMPV